MLRALSTCIPIALLLAACAPAGPAPAPTTTATPSAASDVLLPTETVLVSGLVPRNATMSVMLEQHGLAADAVQAVIDAARTTFDPRRLRSLQPFRLVRTDDGKLRLFEYEIDTQSFLRILPTDAPEEPLRAEVLPIPRTLEHDVVSGSIDATTPSLFQSMTGAGEGPQLAVTLAEIFSGEIDFNTELQPGDRYAAAFERFVREGGEATYGAITAAEFENNGRLMRAIRFTPPDGKPAYYDEQGRSLRRFFLKSPLKFDPRITSRFSRSRLHPVLGTARAHRGVDYAAPHGSEIVAVASGTVVSATYDNANGRMVRLRHAQGYETYYLHMSSFARGMRAGRRVLQGEVIGHVGATGLATGPHLHYGLKKNGTYVDPLTEHRNMPPGEPVPAAAMAAFEAVRDEALAALAAAGGRRTPDVLVASDTR